MINLLMPILQVLQLYSIYFSPHFQKRILTNSVDPALLLLFNENIELVLCITTQHVELNLDSVLWWWTMFERVRQQTPFADKTLQNWTASAILFILSMFLMFFFSDKFKCFKVKMPQQASTLEWEVGDVETVGFHIVFVALTWWALCYINAAWRTADVTAFNSNLFTCYKQPSHAPPIAQSPLEEMWQQNSLHHHHPKSTYGWFQQPFCKRINKKN